MSSTAPSSTTTLPEISNHSRAVEIVSDTDFVPMFRVVRIGVPSGHSIFNGSRQDCSSCSTSRPASKPSTRQA